MSDRTNNREGTMRVAVLGVFAIGIVGVESFAGLGTRIHSSKGYPIIWSGSGASIGVFGDDTLSASLSGAGMKVVKMSMTDVESTVKTGQKLDKVSNRLAGGSVWLVVRVVRVITVVHCVFTIGYRVVLWGWWPVW